MIAPSLFKKRVMTRSCKKEGGYLYEIPLLVLIATLLGGLLWPRIGEPWRFVVGGVVGFTLFLLLWYNRSR